MPRSISTRIKYIYKEDEGKTNERGSVEPSCPISPQITTCTPEKTLGIQGAHEAVGPVAVAHETQRRYTDDWRR